MVLSVPVLAKIGHQKRVHFLCRLADTVPDPQFFRQVRHQALEGVVMDALPHQRDDRKHETGEHEGKQGHDKPGSAKFAAEHGLSQLFLQGRAVCRRDWLRCVHRCLRKSGKFLISEKNGHPGRGDRQFVSIVQARR